MNGRTFVLSALARVLGPLGFTVVLTGALAACDENPSSPPLGSLEITTSAPAVERDVVTADGWAIKFDRYLVHVSAVTVAGADEVVAASATPQIIDQIAPGLKSLLAASVRVARPWENVSLEIGPALPESEITLVAPVTEADREAMTKGGWSLYVEAKATKGTLTKALKWGFTTDTLHQDCEGVQNGALVRGLVVPPDGIDAADVSMSGEVLFSDDLSAPGAALRADAIAAADADNDGTVTLEELRATPLTTARAGGAPYGVGDDAAIADLGAFVEALTRKTVTRFRASGHCTAEPVLTTAP